ncbi:MAG TPA: glycoside hydrolase family 25 protein [Candidatus Limnocylindrales bacterium]|nr:glycoside hydrolase family 25 protein [Candidatus Limnocylindrales bacterium]
MGFEPRRNGIRFARRMSALVLAIAAALASALPGLTATAAAATTYTANCNTNLRASAKLSGTVVDILDAGGMVTADGTVTGDSWSVTCDGDHASNTWYKITAVNGKSTSTLYGRTAVYAATGLFSADGTTPPPTGPYLNGIDISHWQGAVDFSKVKGAGYKFVIAKTSEGIGYTDANWSKYKSGAQAQGLAVTGYHFARPDGNPTKPKEEADWYVSQLKLQPGMLIPALDLERGGGLTPTALTNWVQAWLDEVYLQTGVRPMIYTSPYFWRTNLNDTRKFADQGYNVVWVAHWGVSKPTVPGSNWGGKGWTFWQYGGGPVPGISGNVDLDYYNGTDLTKVTYGANFSLSSSASLTGSIKQGQATDFTISINRTFFTLPVSLSVSGAPAGATATLSSTSTKSGSVTLSVTTSKSGTVTPTGTYTLKVTGTANGITKSTNVTFAVTDGIAPVAAAPSSKQYSISTLGSSSSPIKTAWSATDSKGVTGYTVQRLVNGVTWTTVDLSTATTASISQSLTLGTSYQYRMRASDANGNLSAWAYGSTFTGSRTQQSSTSVKFSSGWTTSSVSSASGGSVKYTKTKGASVSYTFTGSSIAWVSPKGPARGSADVYVDGVLKATVSLYSSTYQAQRIVFAYNWAANGTHTIKIVNKATSGHPRIDVDAFIKLALG